MVGLHAGGKSLAALRVISSPAHSICIERQQGNREKYTTALPLKTRRQAAEKLTTPAGTLGALKVEVGSRADSRSMLNGKKLPPEMVKTLEARLGDTRSIAWYLKGVGLVQNISDSSKLMLVNLKR